MGEHFGSGTIELPFPVFDIAHLSLSSTWHSRCVAIKTVVATKQGWTIKRKDGEDDSAGKGVEISKQLDEIARPGGETSKFSSDVHGLEDLLSNLCNDLENLGNAYLEVLRDGSGKPVEIYHAPAITMRKKARTQESPHGGFYQLQNLTRNTEVAAHQHNQLPKQSVQSYNLFGGGQYNKVYFKEYGDPQSYDTDGQRKDVPIEEQATEIIHLKNYHPLSPNYGIPTFLASFHAIIGDEAAERWNLNFFENNKVPRWMINITGGNMSDEEMEAFKLYFLTVLRGNPHSPIIIHMTDSEAKIECQKLEVDHNEGDFLNYRDKNRDEVLSSHGTPPRMLGIISPGQLGGEGDAETQRKDFNSFTIKPLQKKLTSPFNDLLLPDMGFEEWMIELKGFEADDAEEREKNANSATKLFEKGTISVNETRAAVGLEPIDEEWASGHYLVQGNNFIRLTDKNVKQADEDTAEQKKIDDNLRQARRQIDEKIDADSDNEGGAAENG
jgi:PBSX family phage portal protein